MDHTVIMQKLGDSEEFSPKELSLTLGCHISTIYYHIQSGKLDAYKLFGYRISRASVVLWLQQIMDY